MHSSLQDSILFIEQHKSGFERPADVEFEDYTQGIKAATSDSSLNPPKVRTKLWPFSKKHKVNSHIFLNLNPIFNFREFEGIEQSNNSRDNERYDLKEFLKSPWTGSRSGLPRICEPLLGPELEQFQIIEPAQTVNPPASTLCSRVHPKSKTIPWNLRCSTASTGRLSIEVREMVLGGFP